MVEKELSNKEKVLRMVVNTGRKRKARMPKNPKLKIQGLGTEEYLEKNAPDYYSKSKEVRKALRNLIK